MQKGATTVTILRRVALDAGQDAADPPMERFVRVIRVDAGELQHQAGRLSLHPRDTVIVR